RFERVSYIWRPVRNPRTERRRTKAASATNSTAKRKKTAAAPGEGPKACGAPARHANPMTTEQNAQKTNTKKARMPITDHTIVAVRPIDAFILHEEELLRHQRPHATERVGLQAAGVLDRDRIAFRLGKKLRKPEGVGRGAVHLIVLEPLAAFGNRRDVTRMNPP